MRSFQQLLVFLFALITLAVAQESGSSAISYDATVYITSTVYQVNTVTLSGTPTASVANFTSTIVPSYGTGAPVPVYPSASNGTSPIATGSLTASASQPAFTGAASSMKVNNALVAAFAAVIGYLAL